MTLFLTQEIPITNVDLMIPKDARLAGMTFASPVPGPFEESQFPPLRANKFLNEESLKCAR
jgi:hypothetical protein